MPVSNKPQEKSRLHARNKNRERYDLESLVKVVPALQEHIKPNKYGENSVNFVDPAAVRLLNKALLNYYYGIKEWHFPSENLTPPIPGRADYIHYMADLLGASNFGTQPTGNNITCLDIGVGASCIYPVLGVTEYGWNFIGADIDPKSIDSAKQIVTANASLTDKITLRLQEKSADVLHGILDKEEKVDMTICNPPFHSSADDAQKGTRRKVKNLSGKKESKADLNFGGIHHELICDGGEHKFIHNMIRESKIFASNCYWFSTLVSKQSNLKGIYIALEECEAAKIETIPMGTGNKSTRIVAWTFLNKEERKQWSLDRWKNESNG